MEDAPPGGTSNDPEVLPPFVADFIKRFGADGQLVRGTSAKSALCISGGLLSATIEHTDISEASAMEQREMYLDFLGRDDLEGLVRELTLNLQGALGGGPLGSGCGWLSASINGGAWVHGIRAGAVLTLGRHPRCGLQIADASNGYCSRLQCILVRARGRLIVYDMCSLMGTEGTTTGGGRGRLSTPRTSRSGARALLVFPWGAGAEVQLTVRCDGATTHVSVREQGMREEGRQREAKAAAPTELPPAAAAVESRSPLSAPSEAAPQAEGVQRSRDGGAGERSDDARQWERWCIGGERGHTATARQLPILASASLAPTALAPPAGGVATVASETAAAQDSDVAARHAMGALSPQAASPAGGSQGGSERSGGRDPLLATMRGTPCVDVAMASAGEAPPPPPPRRAGAERSGRDSGERSEADSCVVCWETQRGASALCSAGRHSVCATCFVPYAAEQLAQDRGLVRARRGRLLCPMRAAEAGGCCGTFVEQRIASLLPAATYDAYLDGVRAEIRHGEFVHAASAFREQVVQIARRLKQSVPALSREALARQMREAMPSARQCARCGYGPIDHFACADLALHHGERTSTGAQICNCCPQCGWFARHIGDWPRWGGVLAEGAAEGDAHDLLTALAHPHDLRQPPGLPLPPRSGGEIEAQIESAGAARLAEIS